MHVSSIACNVPSTLKSATGLPFTLTVLPVPDGISVCLQTLTNAIHIPLVPKSDSFTPAAKPFSRRRLVNERQRSDGAGDSSRRCGHRHVHRRPQIDRKSVV